MSIGGVKLHEGWPVVGDRSVRPVRSPGPWKRFLHWRWRRLLLAIIVIVAAAASVLLTLANDYQPLMYGEDSMRNLTYPGLPAGQGIRTVNTFGGIRQDLYIPPQRGTFYLFADIMNGGSRAVIVENVFMPYGSALTPAGRARYARPPEGGNIAVGSPQPSRVLHDVKLGPGAEIFVAIPYAPGDVRNGIAGIRFRFSTSATGSCSSITSLHCHGVRITTC